MAWPRVIIEHHAGSIAIPPLGCGHGGLDWALVHARITEARAPVAQADVERGADGTYTVHLEALSSDDELQVRLALEGASVSVQPESLTMARAPRPRAAFCMPGPAAVRTSQTHDPLPGRCTQDRNSEGS